MTADDWEDMLRSARRKFRADVDEQWLSMALEAESVFAASRDRKNVPVSDDDTAAWLADVIEAGGGPCGPEGME